MSKTLSSALVAMAAAGALLMSPVFAAPTDGTAATTQSESSLRGAETKVKDDWMSLRQAYEALEKAGYKDSDILSLMRSRFGYMAHVLDGEENRIRLLINPHTGAVTAENNQFGNQGHRQMRGTEYEGQRHHRMGSHRNDGARYHHGGRHHWWSDQD